MRQDLFDHRWIFDARNHLDRTAAVVTGLNIDLEHALQALRPRHCDVAGGRWLVGRRGMPAALGRRHLFTQPMIRRKDAVIARQVDTWRRHERGQPGDKVERLKHHLRGTVAVGCFETVTNIPLRR